MAGYQIFNSAVETNKAISGVTNMLFREGHTGVLKIVGDSSTLGNITLGGNADIFLDSGTVRMGGNSNIVVGDLANTHKDVSLYTTGAAEFRTGVGISGNLSLLGLANLSGHLTTAKGAVFFNGITGVDQSYFLSDVNIQTGKQLILGTGALDTTNKILFKSTGEIFSQKTITISGENRVFLKAGTEVSVSGKFRTDTGSWSATVLPGVFLVSGDRMLVSTGVDQWGYVNIQGLI